MQHQVGIGIAENLRPVGGKPEILGMRAAWLLPFMKTRLTVVGIRIFCTQNEVCFLKTTGFLVDI